MSRRAPSLTCEVVRWLRSCSPTGCVAGAGPKACPGRWSPPFPRHGRCAHCVLPAGVQKVIRPMPSRETGRRALADSRCRSVNVQFWRRTIADEADECRCARHVAWRFDMSDTCSASAAASPWRHRVHHVGERDAAIHVDNHTGAARAPRAYTRPSGSRLSPTPNLNRMPITDACPDHQYSG